MHLILCPACARQYDVTGFEPGDRVRCLCDEVISVPVRSALPVTALRCTHCGGAVGANDRECPYCRAALDEKDRERTTLCPACYARLEDGSRHCSGCGLAIRPQALTPLPHDRGCPRCSESLRVRSLGDADVIECEVCAGTWIQTALLEALCADAERRLESALVDRGRDLDGEDAVKVSYIPCVRCSELMLRRQFRWAGRASGVIVDFCRHHGVWLDRDELEHIMAFVRRHGGTQASVSGLAETLGGTPTAPRAKPKLALEPPLRRQQSPFSLAIETLSQILFG